jgi:hypothetical protein
MPSSAQEMWPPSALWSATKRMKRAGVGRFRVTVYWIGFALMFANSPVATGSPQDRLSALT